MIIYKKKIWWRKRDDNEDYENISIFEKKLMMILNFLYNYNKIYTGDDEKKNYNESWGELKIDIDFYTSIVLKDLRK